MSFGDFAAWALQLLHIVLTALVVIALALLLWTLSQPGFALSCSGNQDYSNTNFTGQAPADLTCHVHIPRLGGR